MCVYSTIVDYERKHVHEYYPWVEPYIYPTTPHPAPWRTWPNGTPFVPAGKQAGFPSPDVPTQEQIDKLTQELEAVKKLLKAAEKFDVATGQPDCESEEKVAFLRRLAELLSVDLSEVLP